MGESILVVDDNAQNLKLLRVLLTGDGYEVRTASDADEALAVLNEFSPRVVLMDIQLPGMDGLELTRRLKSDPKYTGLVIIAITAYAMANDRDRALAAGCDAYLSKPIDIDVLSATIADVLKPGNRAP